MGVAIIGLAVNLLSAWLLRDEHHHASHGQDHDHDHAHGHDNKLRAAYLHVAAHALTSAPAIAALPLGGVFGWVWADPLMGVVDDLVILRRSWSLILEVSPALLDAQPAHDDKAARIRAHLEVVAGAACGGSGVCRAARRPRGGRRVLRRDPGGGPGAGGKSRRSR